MKNILVPTNYKIDTIQALKTSVDFKQSNEVHITLLSTNAIPNSISELLFPSQWEQVDPSLRSELLKAWALYASVTPLSRAQISEHHQHNMSRPILSGLLDQFSTDMIIVPFSFQKSKKYIERMLLCFLSESKLPLMLLPNDTDQVAIHRALYLDENENPPTAVIQDFPFHVIHQSMVKSGGLQSIKAIILKFKINLIVLAKGTERRLGQPLTDLGLPVLTI